MIPDHYLHIITGAIVGAPIGFFIASLFTARLVRRATKNEWNQARKFYQNL